MTMNEQVNEIIKTMTAWRTHDFGESRFVKEEIQKPAPGQGELLVKVKATSVNPIDYVIRGGTGAAFLDGLPATLHMDVAGIVEATGEGVTEFAEGDEIYACAGGIGGIPGALADYMRVDQKLAARKPQNISFAKAAALPLVSITAWEGLIDKARVHEGQKVLVHGATGGVGHIGIQLAKWKGATVYATASSKEKLNIGHKIGADEVINYKKEPVGEYVEKHTSGDGFDIVFDTVGGENVPPSIEAAKMNGDVISLAVSHKESTSIELPVIIQKGLSLHGVIMAIPLLFNVGRSHHGEILSEMARLVEDGMVKPLTDAKKFTFDDAAAAHNHAASGMQIGKVIMTHPGN